MCPHLCHQERACTDCNSIQRGHLAALSFAQQARPRGSSSNTKHAGQCGTSERKKTSVVKEATAELVGAGRLDTLHFSLAASFIASSSSHYSDEYRTLSSTLSDIEIDVY